MRWITFAGGLLLTLGTAADLRAQGGEGVTVRSRAVEMTIGGRVQQQLNTSTVDGVAASEFLIRRARPELDIVIDALVEGKLNVDFGEGEVALKDAFLKLSFDPAFELTLGQFKRPFDLFELTSSTQILVVERTGGVRGTDDLVEAAFPGRRIGSLAPFSLSRFTERLRYSDRDIGVQVEGRDRTQRFQWAAALTNGNGANAEDTDGVKAYQLRFGVSPIADLTVWAGASGTPFAVDTTAAGEPDEMGAHEHAVAFQVDAEWGNFDRGWHVQAGVAAGDNWIPVEGTDAEVPRFVAWQAIGTYKVPVRGHRFVQAWEPVLRLSWGDPDTDVEDDGGLLVTPGFVLYFAGRNKIALNYDIWSPQASALDTESSFKAQAYLHF